MASASQNQVAVELILKIQDYVDGWKQAGTAAVDETGKIVHSQDALNTSLSQTSQHTANAGAGLKTFGNEAEHAGEKVQHTEGFLGRMKEKMTEGLGIGIGILGLQNLGGALEKSFDLFEKQEEAERGVELAFDDMGEAGKKAAEDMKVFASARQEVTTFGDEATLKVIQLGKQLGNISDPEKLKRFTVGIQDYAAATGQSMEMVTQSLAAKLEAGGRDRKLGITFDPSDAEGNINKFINATDKKFHGFAEKIADSPTGAIKQFKNAFGDTLEQVGGIFATVLQPLLPILQKGAELIGQFLHLFQLLPGPMKSAISIIAALTAGYFAWNVASNLSLVTKGRELVVEAALKTGRALGLIQINAETGAISAGIVVRGAVTAATWLWNAAQTALNLVMSGNPIAIVVIAVAALVAGIVLAYKHSETFRNILDGVWTVIKKVGEFIFQWLILPYKLLWQVVQLAYEKLGFFRAAVDAVGSAVKAVGGFFSDLFSSSDAASEALEHNAEEAKKAADAQKELAAQTQAAIDAFDAQKKSLDDNVKYLENQIATNLEKKRQAQEMLKSGNLTPEQRQQWQEAIKAYDDANATLTKVGKTRFTETKAMQAETDAGVEYIEGKKKQQGQVKSLIQTVQDYIKEQKALEDTDKQSIATTAENFDTYRAELAKHRADREADITAHIKDVKKRNVALGKLDAEMLEAEAALKDAAEAERQKEHDLRIKAGLDQEATLDAQIAVVRKKYADQNVALGELVKKGALTETDAAKNRAAHVRLEEEEILALRMKAMDATLKLKQDEAKRLYDSQLASAELLANAASLMTGKPVEKSQFEESATVQYYAKLKELRDADAAQRIASATEDISNEEDRAKAIAQIRSDASASDAADAKAQKDAVSKIHEEAIANEKEIALLHADLAAKQRGETKDDLQYKLDAMDIEFEANRKLLDEKYKGQADYQARIDQLVAQHQEDRDRLVLESVEKENVAYKLSSIAIQQIFSKMVEGLKASLSKWLGWEQDQKKKETENDLKLKEIDYKKSMQKLQEDARNSVISYEEYLAKKKKLEDDYSGKSEDDQASHLSTMQEIEQGFVNAVIDLGGQAAQAFISQEIAKLIAGQATATGKFVESVMTLPFPANVLAIGGGVALIATLFSGLLSNANTSKGKVSGAAKGLVHRPGEDGARGQLIAIGETGKEEFAAPRETFIEYARKELTPAVLHSFTKADRDRLIGLPKVNPVLARPTFNNAGMSKEDVHAIRQFTQVLAHINKNGLPVEVTGEMETDGHVLRHVIRSVEKSVQNRHKSTAGGLG